MDTLPHPTIRLEIDLPDGMLSVLRPARPAEIIDAVESLDADEKLPYWAELWPSAVGLASAIAAGRVEVAGRVVTELGSGVGLVALAAARRGAARVVATDWYEECLLYVAASARENGLVVETAHLDWRAPSPAFAADLVLAADVLYEARNVELVLGALDVLLRPGGELVLADPGRRYLDAFVAEALRRGFTTGRDILEVHSPHVPQGRATIELVRLRRP